MTPTMSRPLYCGITLILGLSIIRFFWFVIVEFTTLWPVANATGQSRIHHFCATGAGAGFAFGTGVCFSTWLVVVHSASRAELRSKRVAFHFMPSAFVHRRPRSSLLFGLEHCFCHRGTEAQRIKNETTSLCLCASVANFLAD